MNIQLHQYEPAAFHRLNAFETSKQLLSEHRHQIESLGDVIRDFHFEHSLGICLLHKHFELGSDELLVETIEQDAATIRPAAMSMLSDTIPYMWRLMGLDDGSIRWVPLEFVRKQSVEASHVEFVTQLSTATDFFASFTDRLLSLGVANVFGLALHHRSRIQFDRSALALLETDNISERALSIRPVPRERSASADWTQTLWRFPSVGGVLTDSECDQHGCAGHCGEHGGSTDVVR